MAGLGGIGLTRGQMWQNIGSNDGIGQSAQKYFANQMGLIDSSDPTQAKNIAQNGVLGAIKNNYLQSQLGIPSPSATQNTQTTQTSVTPAQPPSLISQAGSLIGAVTQHLFGE
jgi:hypothetical protein